MYGYHTVSFVDLDLLATLRKASEASGSSQQLKWSSVIGIWYAHFVLKKAVEVPDESETVIAIERGEHNLAVAVAISKSNPEKPMKGQFWRSEEIKRIRGLYGHVRRRLQKKRLLKKVKELGCEKSHKINQQLHITANQIIQYAKQFYKPVIVMENLNGIRSNFKKSKKLNKRFHSLPSRKLKVIIEYKALSKA